MDFDVVVVGAGLVGASFALALRTAGLRIAVVDAHACEPEFDGDTWDSRVYAISPGSEHFLRDCGVWSSIDETRISPVEDMQIWGDDQVSELDFGAYAAGLRELAVIVENRELQKAAWQALQSEECVRIFAPARCRELTLGQDAAELALADGSILTARLIVGADGGDSWVRAQAAIATKAQPYGQTAVVANFATSLSHRNVATQWFQRTGILALLPLPGERVSMVWSTGSENAARLLSLSAGELAAEVMTAARGKLGQMSVITPAAGFDLRIQRVERLVLPRLALIGDAAHNVHPLAGQGVNLGFRDARELAKVLSARGAQHDCGDFALLRRYERARKEDIATMQFTTDALKRLFNNDDPRLAALRNFGLKAVNRQPALKNLLVRQAVG